MWTYRAWPVRAIDGDTIEVVADLGFRLAHTIRIRVRDIDTPELRRGSAESKQLGRDAMAFTNAWLDDAAAAGDWPLVLSSRKEDRSFNRYVADVVNAEGRSLADDLVDAGHAERV